MPMSLESAVDTLYHYFRVAWEASGKDWPYDGREEIRDAVMAIVEAAKASKETPCQP